jgi:hypothetical protein
LIFENLSNYKRQKKYLKSSCGVAAAYMGGVAAAYMVPTHYQVKLQLQLRLSWAATIVFYFLSIAHNVLAHPPPIRFP